MAANSIGAQQSRKSFAVFFLRVLYCSTITAVFFWEFCTVRPINSPCYFGEFMNCSTLLRRVFLVWEAIEKNHKIGGWDNLYGK